MILAFPLLVLVEVYAVLYFLNDKNTEIANQYFISVIPFVLIGVGIWFFDFILFSFADDTISNTLSSA